MTLIILILAMALIVLGLARAQGGVPGLTRAVAKGCTKATPPEKREIWRTRINGWLVDVCIK